MQFLDEESYKIIYFNFKLILDSRRKMVTLSTRVHLSTQLDKKAITTEDVLLESFEGSDVASSDVAAEASDHVSYSLKSDKPDLGSDVENITLNEI